MNQKHQNVPIWEKANLTLEHNFEELLMTNDTWEVK